MVSTEREDGISREGGWHQQRGRMVSTEREDGINREGGWHQHKTGVHREWRRPQTIDIVVKIGLDGLFIRKYVGCEPTPAFGTAQVLQDNYVASADLAHEHTCVCKHLWEVYPYTRIFVYKIEYLKN
jgi:hypothetical protein